MLKIGLLGGSFNPPHAGHVHLATYAKDILNLDEVWLLPVPQNTLKTSDGMAPFDIRLAMCAAAAEKHDWLIAKEDEKHVGTNETIDTITYMQKIYPHTFIWLMGADSFASVHQWGVSNLFFNRIPTAVFARTEAENTAAITSPTAKEYPSQNIDLFKKSPQNGWCFFNMPIHTARATDIRTTSCSTHLSPAVETIIQQENLYQ